MFRARQSLRQISPIPGKWLILCRGTDRHNNAVRTITPLNSTPPLRKNGHIKGSNLKWAYDVLTFMPNYGLKTKRWRWDLSQPLLSLPCFFIQFKRLGREEGKEGGGKRRSISTQRGRGNWFCFASSCSDSWMNCFECAKREVCVCVWGGEGGAKENSGFYVFFDQMSLNRGIN